MLKTTLHVGTTPITVQATNPEEFFQLCALFAKAPRYCGHCGSTDIRPHGDKKKDDDSGWVYCSIRCYDCRHQMRYGKRRDGQFYLRDDEGWIAPYTGSASNTD